MKIIGKIFGWIVGVIFILMGSLFLLEAVLAGILWIAAGALALPPVREKIPMFPYRYAVLPICCICMLVVGAALLPEPDEADEERYKAEAVENTESMADEEGYKAETGKDTEIVANEESGADIKETNDKQRSEKETEKKAADENELIEWITETIYEENANGEAVEISDADMEKWAEISDAEFISAWKKAVLKQVDLRGEEYEKVVDDLELALDLYQIIRGTDDLVGTIQREVDLISDALLANEEIAKKYIFDLTSAKESYKTDDFYITGRLETAYEDNIFGKLQKEVESYNEQDILNWKAYDVEYIFDTPVAGEQLRIIWTDSSAKFPREGVYRLAYLDTGKTIKIAYSGGFEEDVPYLQMIGDEDRFLKDSATYADNESLCSESYRSIMQELEGTTASGQKAADNPDILKKNLPGSYSRTRGPKCGISIWSADETGILFAMAIGTSGYASYVDIRDCIAEWIDGNTAIWQLGTGDNSYSLTFTLQENGVITLSENAPYNEDFPLSGDYITDDIADDTCEFVFPEDNVFPIQPSELEGKTAAECRIARNEIYARYGRKFNDEQLQGYFDTCSWYEGTIEPESFSEELLNEVEKANLQLILEYENGMGG